MTKIKALILSLALCICMLAGCGASKSMSITFAVGTGDKIKVTLDASGGLKLKQTEGGFAVTDGQDDILQAFFVEQAVYQDYMDAVKTQEGVRINETKTEKDITYLSYSYNGQVGEENNFIVWIEGTSTGVVAASLADLETATSVFGKISYTKTNQ